MVEFTEFLEGLSRELEGKFLGESIRLSGAGLEFTAESFATTELYGAIETYASETGFKLEGIEEIMLYEPLTMEAYYVVSDENGEEHGVTVRVRFRATWDEGLVIESISV